MELMRWDPMRGVLTLGHRMHHLFDERYCSTHRDHGKRSTWRWDPVVDIYDNNENIVIKAELPGIDKKDIAVDVKEGVLTVKGERSTANEVKEEKYYRRERNFGKFDRAFTLPKGVDPEKIQADYTDGVLQIKIPKPETKKPKNIAVH
jgi:HSP20 family protein